MSSDVKPLPRGRHNLPRSAVRASQRERLLAAMLELVAERGYAATTVPDVVARARVSRNAFYELFADKTDCFVALSDQLASEVLEEIAAPVGEDWLTALRAGVERYLRWWSARPGFTLTYFVELPSAGVRAIEQRDRQYARFRQLFEGLAAWARDQQPELPPLRPLACRAIVVAVTELIGEETRAGRIDRLPDLRDDVLGLIVTLLADDATARRAA